jgi:hypothetical protein
MKLQLYCSELWFTLFNRVELQFKENVACPKLGVIQEKENNAHNPVRNAFIHTLFLKLVSEMQNLIFLPQQPTIWSYSKTVKSGQRCSCDPVGT